MTARRALPLAACRTSARRALPLAAAAALALTGAACGGGSAGGDGGGATAAPSGPPAVAASSPAAKRGKLLYDQDNCASCHTVDGSDGTGPTFKGLAGSTVKLTDGGTAKADPAYLTRAIEDPDAQVTQGFQPGLMGSQIAGYQLATKPRDVKALVAYIRSITA